MKSIVILYATREGHTKKIAEHLAGSFCRLGCSPVLTRSVDPLFHFQPHRAGSIRQRSLSMSDPEPGPRCRAPTAVRGYRVLRRGQGLRPLSEPRHIHR
jgi:hypothetical protein